MTATTCQLIPITSEAEWLKNRTRDITSTEVAALYGMSPYLTEFELWHRKASGEVVTIADNERMRWGRRLEAAIAEGIAEDQGWTVKPATTYARDPGLRMGASFDYFIGATDDQTAGVLEIKNVDGLVYRDQWEEHQAPAHIELQLQAQLAVLGWSWGAIVPLVGGNEAHVLRRDRDDDICDDIRARVAEFWASIEAGTPPKPDYVRDAEFIVKTLRANANAGEVLDADAQLDALIAEYGDAARAMKEAEQARDAAKARVLELAGTASKSRSAHGSVACGRTKDSPGTLITADMVGTYVGARSGFRQFRFTRSKAKQ